MSQLHVGISFPPEPGILEMIAGVSPRLRVTDLSPWLRDEDKSPEARAKVDAILRDLEVLFIARIPSNLLQRAPKLRWCQWVGTGIDRLSEAGLVGSRVTLTNVTGTNALPIAEHCFLFMLMFAKKETLALAQQKARDYRREAVRPDFLEGKTLGVLGLGGIGSEVARLGKAFHMRVLGLRRSATRRQENTDGVDVLYPMGELHALLGECDHVVVALPLTEETRHLMGEREFRAMKRTAYLVNVGRGPILDEPALIRALKDGAIAGAGLDVFDTEPLPRESELWGLPNALISPHVSGDLIDNRLRATRFFCENLKRYLAGQPLRNIVDPAKGY
jgi:phosphoglycerate dehydrogenase-like enzyme